MAARLLFGAVLTAGVTWAGVIIPDVGLDYVTLKGRVNDLDHSWEYLGIPFAQAGRFEHSRLYSDPLGVLEATKYGAICPQMSAGSVLTENPNSSLILGEAGVAIGPIVGEVVDALFNFAGQERSEDCLFINVQTPQNITADAKLPVLIWIHGGGYEIGSPVTTLSETDAVRAGGINYNTAGLLKASIEMDQPIITVSANYRLNAFGFSASREMEEAGLLNLGLEDQRMAMYWVQKYISKFGGDPDKVTIMGESAGSWSVNAHLLWDDGDNDGLFHGAIASSGGPVMVDGAERQQAVFDNMLKTTNCTDASDKIACLKVAPYDAIMTSVNEEGFLLGTQSCSVPWMIRPDGKHLKDSPHRLAATGNIANVPLMTGDMRDEGTLFSLVAQLKATNDEDFKTYFQSTWWPKATDEDMQGLMELYPQDPSQGSPYILDPTILTPVLDAANNPTPNFKRMASLIGDYTFEAQRRNLLSNWNYTSPVWNYIQDNDVPLLGLLPDTDLTNVPLLGSFHAYDVWFNVNGFLPAAISKNTLHRQATAVSFVRNLDPNMHGLDIPDWPEYTAEGLETYRFVESGPEVVKDDYRVDAMAYINAHPDSFLL
ncbi:unnamed protein product [Discula destructiva]